MLNQLKNIGLSENEAKVYLAMLELGPATMLEISAKAGINRPTAYVQVEALKKLGLVSTQTKGKKQLFMAESPEQLESVLDSKNRELEQKKGELGKVLPELLTLFNLGDAKPEVRFFEGKEGLLRMEEEFLKAKEKNMIGIMSLDDVLNVFPESSDSYTKRRIKKGIHTRSIYTYSKGPIFKDSDPATLRESKFISPEKLPFNVDITVYDDIVAIAALRGRVSGAMIRHQEIANSFKNFLNLIWNFADKL